MESYSVQAMLSVDDNMSPAFKSASNAVGAFNKATGSNLKSSKGGMIKFGAITGAAMAVVGKAMNVVRDSVGAAASRFDTLNKYPVVMKALGYSAKDTNKSMKVLNNGIDGLPTSLDEITKSAQNFAPLTGGATSGAKAAVALNDAFLASGASVSDASRGMTQYSQMLATGKVDLISYRTLQETMPIALRQVAKAFGYTGKSAEQDLFKALKSGKITVDQLNDKFVELDKGQGGFAELARKNSEGIATSFANAKTAVVKGLANMLKAIDQGMKNAKLGGLAENLNKMKNGINTAFAAINSTITKMIPPIVDAFKSLFTFIKNNQKWLEPLTIGVAAFIGTFNGLQKISGIVSNVAGAFRGFFSLLAANPFVLLIAGVVAAVAALVYFFTQTKTGQAIWASFTAWLVNAWNVIKATAIAVWTAIGTFFTTVWSGIVSVVTTVWTTIATFLSTVWTGILTVATTIWSAIKAFFTTIWSGVSSVTISVWTTISTFLSGIWNGIKTIASGVWQGIKAVIAAVVLVIYSVVTGNFSLLKQTVVALWNALKSAAGTVWNGIKQVISAAVNAVKSVVTSVWNGIKSVTSSVWNGIKSVISSVVKAISSAVKSAWNALKSATSSTFNAIKSVGTAAFNGLKSLVISAAHAMVSGALSAWRSMVSGVRSVVSGIKSAFNVLKNINLVSVGRNIIQGLINGVRSGASALRSALKSMASSAVKAAKSVLKIHSPSKVFYGIGGYVGQGFVNGIDSMQKQVQRVTGSMGNMASDALNSNVQALNSRVNGSISSNFNTTMDQSPIDNVANKVITAIREGHDIVLDGNTLVGHTADRMDNHLGNNVRLRGRLS